MNLGIEYRRALKGLTSGGAMRWFRKRLSWVHKEANVFPGGKAERPQVREDVTPEQFADNLRRTAQEVARREVEHPRSTV